MEDRQMVSKDTNQNQVIDEENCHGQEGGHNGMKHGVMMMICCMLPILIVIALPLFGFSNTPWSWIIFALCPIMHIGMMFFMKEKH